MSTSTSAELSGRMCPHAPDIGVIELLEVDPRPTFIAALPQALSSPQPESPQALAIVYANPALRADGTLYDGLDGISQPRDGGFWSWIRSGGAQLYPNGRSSPRTSITFMSNYWTRSVVNNRWVVVGGNNQSPPPEGDLPGLRLHHRRETSGSLLHTTTTEPLVDGDLAKSWILPDFTREQEPFVDTVNSFDWASTPLGPASSWPALLHHSFNQILADSRPIAIYWGNGLTTLYNEAFSRKLCAAKPSSLLGRPVDDVWPYFYGELKQNMQASASRQSSKDDPEWCVFVENPDGTLVETYLKWTIVPITENKRCLGFIHALVDTTLSRLWERRTNMLVELGDTLVTARDVKSYWAKLFQNLEAVRPSYDVPLAILYSVNDGAGSSDPRKTCRLEGNLGVPDGHPLIPPTISLSEGDGGLCSAFREAIDLRSPILLQTKDGTLPESLLDGLNWRGFGNPCREAVIFPILPTKDEYVTALLLLGLNPRRPYDNGYKQYISLLNQKLASTLAATVLLEEEARRGRNMVEQAAYDRAKLQEKLESRTKEVDETTQKFQCIAEFIPIGMYFSDCQGRFTFANDSWHRITGQPKTAPVTPEAFLACVVEEDQPTVRRAYDELRRNLSITIEFRVRRSSDDKFPLQQPKGSSPSLERAGLDLELDDGGERHVLASLKAEHGPDGSFSQVLACLTDITLHKKAAEEAIRRAQQAEHLKRMAEFATVGLYDMDLEGRLISANKVFYEMCGIEKADLSQTIIKPFSDCVVDADYPNLQQTLAELIKGGKTETTEIRLKTTWVATDSAGDAISAPRCVVATFMPVRNSEGAIQSFTGCLSDVSLQRWQLERERQRKHEAIESKRQQENFIDITSHEMRNPLSAIVQAADTIIASLTKAQELVETHVNNNANGPSTTGCGTTANSSGINLLKDGIEGAEIIVACAAHQKRIVDDILTMSKLDSNLLTVTPTTVNPIQVVRQAFKMFEVEARRVDINLTMKVDQSYHDLDIDFLDLDPSRLKQVLINLLTNALKFTKDVTARNVSVEMSASKTRPKEGASSVRFIPPGAISLDDAQKLPSVPEENRIYLMFKVTDTGQGITEEEMSTLFQRFSQASAKTHVKYGGSGLGLFISRQLTEMQNGAIGVASRPGHGSTFAFYIEAHTPSAESLRDAKAAVDVVENLMRLSRSRTHSSPSAGNPEVFETETAPVEVHIKGVLIVEDNLINQQISRRGLLEHGYEVEVANHGLEALEKLQRTTRAGGDFPLDLILMDIEMPSMDGLTCTRNIREMERAGQLAGSRIPIVAVSANARAEQILKAKAAGCDDVLVKPFRMPELIDKMTNVVRALKEA
ncbi:hypothetical protein DL766_006308 [Monosporascus sp. MC13-8B]|nr:hypothetical protein DL766_006308 [Monosporascus sp. MC13-8B]